MVSSPVFVLHQALPGSGLKAGLGFFFFFVNPVGHGIAAGLLWDGSQFLCLSCDKDGAEQSQREGTGNKNDLIGVEQGSQ